MTIKSRKPNRFEMTLLFAFHGILTASVLLTYISEDDIYFMHQFAGYVAGGALALRLLSALIAPKDSPLRFRLPKLFASGQGGRNPVFAWMGVALIVLTVAAVLSGLLAQETGIDGLHEALAEGLLPLVIFAHAVLVLWKPLLRKLATISAEDVDRALDGFADVANAGMRLLKALSRRAKPQTVASTD